jgi:hypothetical protein
LKYNVKYSQEEERFANALIEEFEKGTILDCENGCTLRAYLSRKLHCAPMRISKKYAGKSIGKHVFLSRIPALLNRNGVNVNVGLGGLASSTAGGNVNGNMNIRSTNENLDKIRDLQFHFHMSLLQEGAACALGQNIGKSLTSGATSTSARVGGLNVNVAAAVNCVQGGHMHASVLPRTAAGVPACAPSNGAGFPLIFPTPHSNVSYEMRMNGHCIMKECYFLFYAIISLIVFSYTFYCRILCLHVISLMQLPTLKALHHL